MGRSKTSAPSDEGGGPIARKRRGRPRASDPRTSRLEIRMTPDELARVEQAATRAGSGTVSGWVRDVVLEAAQREPAPPTVPVDEAIEATSEALRELVRKL